MMDDRTWFAANRSRAYRLRHKATDEFADDSRPLVLVVRHSETMLERIPLGVAREDLLEQSIAELTDEELLALYVKIVASRSAGATGGAATYRELLLISAGSA